MTANRASLLIVALVLGIVVTSVVFLRDEGYGKGGVEKQSAATVRPDSHGSLNEVLKSVETRGAAEAETYEQTLSDLLAIAGSDVDAAVAKAKTKFTGDKLTLVVVYLAQEVASKDWSLLKAFLSHLPSPSDKQAVISLVAARAVARDTPGFLRFAKGQDSADLQGELLRYAVSALASAQRFDEGAEAFELMSPSGARSDALMLLASRMARQDPKASIAWADHLELADERTAALKSLVMFFKLNRDAASIRALAEAIPDPGIKAMCERQLGEFKK